MTKTFIQYRLLPIGFIFLLLIALVYLTVNSGFSGDPWKMYLIVLILVLIAVFFSLVIRQTLKDERERRVIAGRIEASDEKYRSLLETSADGTLIIMDREIVHANFIFLAMSGYTFQELHSMKLENLIFGNEKSPLLPEKLYEELGENGRTRVLEASIACKRGDKRDVVLSLSKIELKNIFGVLVIIKDMSGRERIEQETSHLQNELHSSILMMNLPISSFAKEYASCGMDDSIQDAARLMQRKKQNAVIITRDGGDPAGILTDSDLRNRVIAGELDYKESVFKIMSSPLIRIPDQALLYEGILQIKEHGISHLVVEDRNGNISGIISNEDLLEIQRNSISYLIKEVNAAETVDSLKKIHNKIPVLVKILMESGAKIQNITYMISTVTDAITTRLIEFAIEEMGEPPAKFAFMALGSEGRREQTLVTDQDNAILIEDVPNNKYSEVSRYFLYFGKKINLWLDRIGYQYCKGDVMAGNPQWCQPVLRWKSYFSNWIGQKSEEGILGMAVFFDFRVVYGEEQLAQELRQHINSSASGKKVFFSSLAKNIADIEIPSDIFKRNGSKKFTSEPESINIKNALAPLTGYIRVYALHSKVTESNSLQRLEKLRRLNIIPDHECHELENMYCRLMEIRFRSQVNAILANRAPDNMVGEQELAAIEQTIIRKTLSEVTRFQDMILNDFST